MWTTFCEDLNIINGLKSKLLERFRMTDLGSVFHYLSMFVTQTGDSVRLDQRSYLEKVLTFWNGYIQTCLITNGSWSSGLYVARLGKSAG